MATFTYEDGTKVDFKNPPTPQDIQEAAQRLGIKNKQDNIPEQSLASSIIREIPPIAGSTIGEIVGGPGGSGLGGAVGETLSQGIERLAGRRQSFDPKAIAQTGAAAAVVPLAFGAFAKALAPAGRIVGAGLKGFKAVAPGISKETSEAIGKYPAEVEALAKQTSIPINPILEKIQNAKTLLLKKAGQEFETIKTSLRGTVNYSKDKTVNAIKSILTDPNTGFGIKLAKNGSLDFSSSPFKVKTIRRGIEDAYDEIKNTKIKTLDDLRNLKSRLNEIRLSVESAFAKKPQSFRVFNKMVDAIDDSLPAELKEANKLYTQRLRLSESIDNNLIPTIGKDIKPSSLNKIKNLGKEEYQGLYKNMIEGIKSETGLDLEKELKIFNAAREINPNLIPQDVGGIFRGIQKAANPIIGQSALEIAKSPLLTALKSGITKTARSTPAVASRSAKIGLFEAFKGL